MAEQPAITFERLLDWLEGRLAPAEADQLAAQIERGSQAQQADLAWLREFRAASAALVIEAPPPATHSLLQQRFADFAARRRPPSLLRRLVATLTFDSGLQPLGAGVRSADLQPPPRQLVFASEVADMTLNMQPRAFGQQIDLTCQIFPKGAATPLEFTVELLQAGVAVASAATDELGECTFEALPSGAYTVRMSGGGAEVEAGSVELRA